MIIIVFLLITTWYDTSKDHRDLLIYKSQPNPSGRTGPGVDSASNRNEYQESLKNKQIWG
jgi:hypothetical protein